MCGEIWGFTRTEGRGTLQPPQIRLSGWEEERERPSLFSPPPGPGWTHRAVTLSACRVPPLSPHLAHAEKAAFTGKRCGSRTQWFSYGAL